MEVFCDVPPCGWVSCAWCFGVSQCLHLQGQGNLDCCTKALGSFETSVCTHPVTQRHSPGDHLKSCRVTGATQQLLDTEEKDPPAHWLSIYQQWVSSPVTHTELLLLYSRDCKEFCDVMQAFSQLLKRFGNMKVSADALETWCYSSVSSKYVASNVWMVKVVWSFKTPVVVYQVSTALMLQQVLL